MSSVTQRINEIKQPYGGYIKPSQFTKIEFVDDVELHTKENMHPTNIGLVVDYLTRFMIGTQKEEAFIISLTGANVAESNGMQGSLQIAKSLLDNIIELDNQSIINACKLTSFDCWYRNITTAESALKWNQIWPNQDTIDNIRTMVARSIRFFEQYGPIIQDGFTFEPPQPSKRLYLALLLNKITQYGGYTSTVTSGDGDFLTDDTLRDFKVSKSSPTSKHTLQLIMYWIMGQYSGQEIFKNITKVGLFNPRLNTAYLLRITDVDDQILQTIEKNVICYK